MQLFLHQVTVLTLAELRELLWRRRSLLSLILYSLIILLSAWLLFKVHATLGAGRGPIDLDSPDHAELAKALDKMNARGLFDTFMRLGALPAALWIFQIFSLFWFPMLVGLVSCDCIALDVYRGTLRFVLLRSSRVAYYTAKMCSHFVLYAVLQLLSLLMVLLYSVVAVADSPFLPLLRLTVQYFLVFLPFLWCVVASTQFISSWSGRPMNALIRVHVMWVGFIFILAVAPWASPLWSKILVGLFVPFDGHPIASIFGYSAWGALFTLAGLLFFLRRDV